MSTPSTPGVHDGNLATQLKGLSSAEDFLRFFGIEYDERVVHVNRLHILKRFFQYLQREGAGSNGVDADEVATYRRYRTLLLGAYQDFVKSSAQAEKVFKVFQQAEGVQHVSLNRLRDAMAERTAAASA
jgi:nitrogenase-stabilizing/protective protein